MNLNEHTAKVVKRARAFYAKKEPGHFLVSVSAPVERPEIPPLYEFDLDRQLNEWLEWKLKRNRPYFRFKEGIDDDALPVVCPHFGIAEHSAWLGMEVHLQRDTCLPVLMLKEPGDIEKLTLSENTKWFRYMKEGYDYLRSRKDGTFYLSTRGMMTPMDLADALRGNEIYTDFLLEPEFCHRLMEFLTKAVEWYFRRQLSWADDIDGGRAHILSDGGWMPENTIGHLSNDAAMLCSPEVYETFGYPYEKLILEKYDHAMYHLHNEKLHYFPGLCSLPRLSLLEISMDPKTKPPIEDLGRIFSATAGHNLLIHSNSSQVRANIEELKERNVFLTVACKDRKDAEDILEFTRGHSKPLE